MLNCSGEADSADVAEPDAATPDDEGDGER